MKEKEEELKTEQEENATTTLILKQLEGNNRTSNHELKALKKESAKYEEQ